MPRSCKWKNNIGVVICTLNEEKTIGDLVNRAKKYASEVCIVDGHSKDKTVQIARKSGASILYDEGKGKGNAIRIAVKKKNYPVFVFMDADCSHDPDEIPKLVKPIFESKADHVTGSRLLGGSDELHGTFDEFLRLAGSAFVTWCINARFNVRLSDSQNGFRAVKGKVLKELDLKEDSTTIEQEMIMKTLKKGYRIDEVPTHEYKRKYGTSRISVLKQAHRYLFSLVKYLFF
ncbi:glycosyltransferase family 2 protein [Candidatus Dojkabacteria bacterium]|nr:glycosyltransferase family 2 protein [Candidatus Dojkabacteria bacterium]